MEFVAEIARCKFCVIHSIHKIQEIMGAVHGVYLKYVGLSAVSYAGYTVCVGGFGPVGIEPLPSTGGDILATTMIGERSTLIPLLRLGASSILKYSALLNGTVAVLFKLRRGKTTPVLPIRRNLRPQTHIYYERHVTARQG